MKKARLLAVLGLALLPQLAPAHGGVRVGVGFNFGGPYYGRPWYPGYGYGGYYGYYGPPIVYAAPPQVIYAPQPTVVQVPAGVAAPSYAPVAAPAPTYAPVSAPTAQPAVVQANHAGSAVRVDGLLQQLSSPQEPARRDAAIDLGRLKAPQAIDPLTSVLAQDSSPMVRDAAARALGLIGSPRGLNALIHAAQADNDRDVRHSAQFAVEVIRANLRAN